MPEHDRVLEAPCYEHCAIVLYGAARGPFEVRAWGRRDIRVIGDLGRVPPRPTRDERELPMTVALEMQSVAGRSERCL